MNKSAIITGASRGIGREIARTFAKNNYSVVINYNKSERDAVELQKEIQAFGGIAEIFRADVGEYGEANALIDFCVQKFGSTDVLVNNAGIAQIKLFTDVSPDDWNVMVKTNLTGVFNCCQAAVRHMVARKTGSIINISSMWGQTGASCEVHYSAVKGGVIALTKALAKEVGLSNVRVNCVCPGMVETDMTKGLSPAELRDLKDEIPLNKFGCPSDIAETALFLASDKAGFITGQIVGVNGGMVI